MVLGPARDGGYYLIGLRADALRGEILDLIGTDLSELVPGSETAMKVKAALIEDPVTKAHDINVETYRGVVQLGGFVECLPRGSQILFAHGEAALLKQFANPARPLDFFGAFFRSRGQRFLRPLLGLVGLFQSLGRQAIPGQ